MFRSGFVQEFNENQWGGVTENAHVPADEEDDRTPVAQPLTPRGQDQLFRETPQTPGKRRKRTSASGGMTRVKTTRNAHGGKQPPPVAQPGASGHRKTRRSSDDIQISVDGPTVGAGSVERRLMEMDLDSFRPSVDSTSPSRRFSAGGSLSLQPVALRMSQATDFSSYSQDTTASQMFSRRMLTEYQEIRELGHGSYGRVVLARELASGEYCAVKMITVSIPHCRKNAEYAALSTVRGFPHVVMLYNGWVEGSSKSVLYLHMQYCCYGALSRIAADRREQAKLWRESEVLTILGQIGIALNTLHSCNIVHVDIKPENILLDHRGQYFLSDFGNALFLDPHGRPCEAQENATPDSTLFPSNVESSQQSPGFPSSALVSVAPHQPTNMSQDEGDCRYVALDMMNEKQYFKAGDIFSLGMSLYEVMSGAALPCTGEFFHSLRNRSAHDERGYTDFLRQRGYSESLCRLVMQMTRKDPLDRPTAAELLNSPLLRPNNMSMGFLGASISLPPTPAATTTCSPEETDRLWSPPDRTSSFGPNSSSGSGGFSPLHQDGATPARIAANPLPLSSDEIATKLYHATCFEVAYHLLAASALPPLEGIARRRQGIHGTNGTTPSQYQRGSGGNRRPPSMSRSFANVPTAWGSIDIPSSRISSNCSTGAGAGGFGSTNSPESQDMKTPVHTRPTISFQ